MSDTSLRGKTIRLAASFPDGSHERKMLLAALHQARGEMKLLLSGDRIRVRWSDHPDNSLEIQELPSKPLKKRLRRRTYTTYYMVQWFHPGSAFLMENILRDAKLSKSMDFDAAVRAMDAALEMAKDTVLTESVELNEKYKESHPGIYQVYTEEHFAKLRFPQSAVRDEEVYFLEVEPADYEPISFKGRGFGGTSKWNGFKFTDDKDDDEYMRQVEGMQAFYTSTSPAGSRKLFKLLKADPDAVKAMTADQFKRMLDAAKIGYEYVPTVWR